jgi:hypothetical protein
MGKARNSKESLSAVVTPIPDYQRRGRNERRCRERLNVSLPARLRTFDVEYWRTEEVQTTLNFTRNGLYFTTWTEHYALGMRVLVTLPYRSAGSAHREYLGRVARLERLADGRLGVALQFVF